MSDNESPAETIARLERLNNQLAQMLKRGSDRLQESARELMAQGWEAGANAIMTAPYDEALGAHVVPVNPYRQPIDLLGGGAE